MNCFYRLLLLLLAGSCVTGCDSPGGKQAHRHGRADSLAGENSPELRPDVFTVAPGDVEGCVGLYTYDSLHIAFDSLDVDKGKKILATVATNFAFLRLHGKNIVLRYDSAESRKLGDKEFKEVYRGNGYTAVLITHTLQEEGEAVKESGTLEISHGNIHFSVKVKGLAGC